MTTPRAMITGDLGFLGRYFREALDRRGWHVAGLDTKRSPMQDMRRQLPTFGGHWDLLVHAAAVIGGREQIEGDPLALAVNLELDACAFRWAARVRPTRTLYLSSSAVYPVGLQAPTVGDGVRLRETDLKPGWSGPPDRVYGWSKLVGEALAAEARAQGLAVTVVRPFSGYGPGQDLSYPFPAFIGRARARQDPFVIWGTGEQVRDWIHVTDLVEAALRAVEQGWNGPLNLCTGRGVSFADLARLVTREAGYRPRLEPHPEQPAGVAYRVGDPRRLQQLYTPKVPLLRGIRQALSEGEQLAR